MNLGMFLKVSSFLFLLFFCSFCTEQSSIDKEDDNYAFIKTTVKKKKYCPINYAQILDIEPWGIYLVSCPTSMETATYIVFPKSNMKAYKKMNVLISCKFKNDRVKWTTDFINPFYHTLSSMLNPNEVDSSSFIEGLKFFMNNHLYHPGSIVYSGIDYLKFHEGDAIEEAFAKRESYVKSPRSDYDFNLTYECLSRVANRENVFLFQNSSESFGFVFWSYDEGMSFDIQLIK